MHSPRVQTPARVRMGYDRGENGYPAHLKKLRRDLTAMRRTMTSKSCKRMMRNWVERSTGKGQRNPADALRWVEWAVHRSRFTLLESRLG